MYDSSCIRSCIQLTMEHGALTIDHSFSLRVPTDAQLICNPLHGDEDALRHARQRVHPNPQ